MSRFENTDTGRPYSPHAPPNTQLSESRTRHHIEPYDAPASEPSVLETRLRARSREADGEPKAEDSDLDTSATPAAATQAIQQNSGGTVHPATAPLRTARTLPSPRVEAPLRGWVHEASSGTATTRTLHCHTRPPPQPGPRGLRLRLHGGGNEDDLHDILGDAGSEGDDDEEETAERDHGKPQRRGVGGET